MLIKSQSGKQIVNFDKYNGICIGYPNESDFKIYAVLEVDSEHISQVELGIYSSENKAQKVLDWILDSYSMNLLLNLIPESKPRDLFDEYVAEQMFGIFEMPSDEEVEV